MFFTHISHKNNDQTWTVSLRNLRTVSVSQIRKGVWQPYVSSSKIRILADEYNHLEVHSVWKSHEQRARNPVYFLFIFNCSFCLPLIRKKRSSQIRTKYIAVLSVRFQLPILFFSFFLSFFPPKSLIPRQCYSEMAIFPAFLQNYTIYWVNIYRFRKYH